MPELEKRISGDWIELREKSNDVYTLLETLAVPSYEMRGAAAALRFSVEEGIVEYKRSLLAPVFSILEAARFTTIASESLATYEKSLGVLLLVILLQRLICMETIPLARPQEEKRVFGVDGIQVGSILSDVNTRMKANPELRSHVAIKNITMQVQRYNAENQKMRELLPTIKPEMRTAFLANFTRTFEELIGSIRRNYTVLLQEELVEREARRPRFSLSLMPMKELVPLLASQAKEIAVVRSTLAFAREEKYKTRESLVRLYDGRSAVLKLLDEEGKVDRLMCQKAGQADLGSCALAVAGAFRDEIVTVLERQAKRLEAEQEGADGASAGSGEPR